MTLFNAAETAVLLRCQNLTAPAIRELLSKYPSIGIDAIEGILKHRLKEPRLGSEYFQGLSEYRQSISKEALEDAERTRRGPKYLRGVPECLQGIPDALIALLPSSYESVNRILSMTSPAAIYELHFKMFALLERDEFNRLEQDGIEHLLGEYLMNVRSTAAFAAWKAGLVLAEEWLSARSEKLLIELISRARFPAGRLGATNGYRWLVRHKQTYSSADLVPLQKAARNDPSKKVRDNARFHLRLIKEGR